MKKIGVVLSGCGVFDGCEIHEAVCTLLAIERAGAQAVCMAPDKSQTKVVNHATQKESQEKRNILVESARIARGKIQPISAIKSSEIDALVIPGGFGAALNLSNFAIAGEKCEVDGDLAKLISEMMTAGKPVGAMCIAPPILAKICQAKGTKDAQLTIGQDPGTAEKIEAMGAKHVNTKVDEVTVDKDRKLVTTACYMLATNISQIADAAEKVIKNIIKLCG